MKLPHLLAAGVCVGALGLLTAPARPALANGGVIILLQADYHFHLRDGQCDTLVIVARDRAVDRVVERIEAEGDTSAAVHVEGTHLSLDLTPVDEAHLTGFSMRHDHPVLVVSRTYAAEHNWHRHPHPSVDGGSPEVSPCSPAPPLPPPASVE